MPRYQDFTYFAYVDLTTGFVYSTRPGQQYTLIDDNDGDLNDNSTAVGDSLKLGYGFYSNYAGQNAVFLAGTIASGVVFTRFPGASLGYLLSTATYENSTIALNTTDPYTYCFLSGTLIATPRGNVPVEYLAIGDQVTTADGRSVPIKWIGVQKLKNNMFTHHSKAPVCISAGALGDGLPQDGLYISSDHGLILDGMVVNAGALVNHTTIRFVSMAEMPAEFTYYHIETEAHDEILANGAPAETFIDYVGRKYFDNYQEYIDIYGHERIIPEMKRPRISSQRQLPQSLYQRFGITDYGDQIAAEMGKLEARLANDGEETDWDALLKKPDFKIVARRNAA